MPVQPDDLREILYSLARGMALRASDTDRQPPFPEVVGVQRGMVRFADLVYRDMKRDQMSLDHLVVVSNAAVQQVKAESGFQSDEYKGALLQLTNFLAVMRGAWIALGHPLLSPYRR